MADFPKRFFRGVGREKYVDEFNLISHEVFVPNKKTAEYREDSGYETSINWEDNEEVLEFTFKDRQISPHGVVGANTEEIQNANSKPNLKTLIENLGRLVFHERAALDTNPFHGNIVFSCDLPKAAQRAICSHLALHSTYYPRPQPDR
ncbi:MAG TPA: hypothetical protein P5121_21375 [Caldilineaceae bacterium]|nr:hypothetical protein [Caldilineaceae bacterium]